METIAATPVYLESIQSKAQRAKEIFFEAVDSEEGPKRQQYILEACQADAKLLAQLCEQAFAALLAFDESMTDSH